MINLPADESVKLATTLAIMSGMAKRQITIEGLIESWRVFVEEVESGYSLTGYDYTNDLSSRDLIGEVLGVLSSDVRNRIEVELIEAIDDRFRAATRALPLPLSIKGPHPPPWWWIRAPNDLTGELARDLLIES